MPDDLPRVSREPVPPRAGKGRRPSGVGDRMTRERVGEPRSQGRLAGPTGPFVLAPALTAPGALPLSEALDLVCADMQRQAATGAVEASTVYMTVNQARRFEQYALRNGVVALCGVSSELVELFLHSPNAPGYGIVRRGGRPGPVSNGTKHARRAALRMVFKTVRVLGLDDRDPSRDIVLPPRTAKAGRATTDAEVQRCRESSHVTLTETRLPCALALVLAGQTTAEITYARVGDVHLDARLVWAHGGGGKTAARWLPLDDWAVTAISRRIEWVTAHPSGHAPTPEDEALTYRPVKKDNAHHIRQGSGSNTVAAILRLAGLSTTPGIRPMSLNEWVGQAVYAQTGSLAAVASRLGMASLDAVADLLDIDWRTNSTTAGPPGVTPRPTTRASRTADGTV